MVNKKMSNSKNAGNNGITTSVLAFGAAMFAVGLILGYMLAPKNQAMGPSAESPAVASTKVVNNTPGELRKLSEQEKRELTRKQNAPKPTPQAPSDSPFLTDAIKAKIFGLNSAAIYGIDPEARLCAVSEDDIAKEKQALLIEPGRRIPTYRHIGPQTRRELFDFLRYNGGRPG